MKRGILQIINILFKLKCKLLYVQLLAIRDGQNCLNYTFLLIKLICLFINKKFSQLYINFFPWGLLITQVPKAQTTPTVWNTKYFYNFIQLFSENTYTLVSVIYIEFHIVMFMLYILYDFYIIKKPIYWKHI